MVQDGSDFNSISLGRHAEMENNCNVYSLSVFFELKTNEIPYLIWSCN